MASITVAGVARSPFNASTREKIAVCAAFGLAFWSDHPAPGCMWAVDDGQRAHVVRWYRKRGEAALQSVSERQVRHWGELGIWVWRTEYRTFDVGERVSVSPRPESSPVLV